MLGQVLSEDDIKILQSLKRLDLEQDDVEAKVEGGESNRVKLTFTFEKNDFFSNKTLSKTVVSHNGPGGDECGEEGEYEVESDKIEWKKGKGPAEKSNAKETKKGNTYGHTRQKTKKGIQTISDTEQKGRMYNYFYLKRIKAEMEAAS